MNCYFAAVGYLVEEARRLLVEETDFGGGPTFDVGDLHSHILMIDSL